VVRSERWVSAALGLSLCFGCRSSPPSHAVTQISQKVGPADSLVLAAPYGRQVWLTLVRPDRAGDGTECLERGLEIRSAGGRSMPVPLLYTGDHPALVNDSTFRATLWINCRAGDSYLVDLRTGHPVRERHGPTP
jgi:hypothetical protein